jgi:hypothetical protein
MLRSVQVYYCWHLVYFAVFVVLFLFRFSTQPVCRLRTACQIPGLSFCPSEVFIFAVCF